MHNRMLDTVMRAPMLFFDTTPYVPPAVPAPGRTRRPNPYLTVALVSMHRLGRIVNRFAKDQNTVDEALPRAFQSYLRQFASVMGIFIVISYSTPIFLAAIVPRGSAGEAGRGHGTRDEGRGRG